MVLHLKISIVTSRTLTIIALLWNIILFSQTHKKVNRIDSLKSVKDIQRLFEEKKIDNSIVVSDKIEYNDRYRIISDTLNFKPWTKGDFDHNGLTDLLITGNTKDGPKTICIMDMGNNFEVKKISKGELYETCAFATAKEDKIEYKSKKILSRYGFLSNLETDYLVYAFGEFMEENNNPKRHDILEIEFNASGCFGHCPSFELKIVSNRDIEWVAQRYNNVNFREYSGTYEAKIPQDQYKELITILNYIDFENLNEEYNVGYTDAPTGTLTIIYDDMKIKKINDYGMRGTRGLQKLYDILFDLRGRLEWEK